MKTIALLLLCVTAVPGAYAATAGTSAASFLKIDASARSAALAGAMAAPADDSNTLFYNPAGLAQIERGDASFTHNEWIEGVRMETLSVAAPLADGWGWGAGVNYLFTDKVDKTDVSGNNIGTFNATAGAFTAGVGKRLGQSFYAGANIKVVREAMADNSGSAVAGDVGSSYRWNRLNVAFSMSNIGSSLKMGSEGFPLPLTWRLGSSWQFNPMAFATAQVDKANDSDTVFRLAGEYRLTFAQELTFALRAGFRTAKAEETGSGFTLGAGFGMDDYRFDYAFVPMGDLGSTHRMSLCFKFGTPRDSSGDAEAVTPRRAKKKRAADSIILPKIKTQVTDDGVSDTPQPRPVKRKKKTRQAQPVTAEDLLLL